MAAPADPHPVVITDDGRRIRPVKSVEHALDLLDQLADDGDSMSLTDLVSRTGLSKTATYNLLTTLELRGLVRRTHEQRYELGWGLLVLGELVRTASSLGDGARRHLEDLADNAGETAVLAILDRDRALCLDLVDARRSVPHPYARGRRIDTSTTAAGLVLAAFAPVGKQRRLAGIGRSDRLTTDRLEAVKHDASAVVAGPEGTGLISLAVPVLNDSRHAVASLSVVAPQSRVSPTRRNTLLDLLREHSSLLSRSGIR